MTDARATEVVARSFVPEAARPIGPRIREEQQNWDAAQKLREKRDARPDDPLAAFRPDGADASQVSLNLDAKKQLERRIDTTSTSFAAAEAALKRVTQLTEKGFESFDTDPYAQAALVAEVQAVLDRIPAFDGFTPDMKAAAAQDILKKDAFRRELGTAISIKLHPEEPLVVDTRGEARGRRNEARNALTSKEDEYRQISSELSNNKTKREGYRLGGALQVEKAGLEASEAGLTTANQRIQRELERGGRSREQIDYLRAVTVQKINAGQTLSADEQKMSDMIKNETKLTRLNEMREEERTLPERIAAGKAAKATLAKEVASLTKRAKDTQRAVDAAKTGKSEQEAETADKMQKLLSEAVATYINVAAENSFADLGELRVQEAAGTQNAILEKLAEKMKTRWDLKRSSRVLRREEVVAKRQVLDEDMALLAHENGNKALVQKMLLEDLQDAPGDDAATLARKATEREKIAQYLSSPDNEAAVKEWANKATLDVLKRRVAKRPLSDKEYHALEHSGAIDAAIEEALKDKLTREGVRKAREAARGAHGEASHGEEHHADKRSLVSFLKNKKTLGCLFLGPLGLLGVMYYEAKKKKALSAAAAH